MDVIGLGLFTFDIMIKLPELPTWAHPARKSSSAQNALIIRTPYCSLWYNLVKFITIK